MERCFLARHAIPIAGIIGFAGVVTASSAAEIYRWTDERGVVNYSNEPPPKGRLAKDVRIVEDRLSIYTPEKLPSPVAGAQIPPSASFTREPPLERRASTPPPPPVYDPCLRPGNDPNCYGAVPYDGSPVFAGRHRPPRLVQPQLPAGATAGNVTGSTGYTAGQSANAPYTPVPGTRASRSSQPSASFTLKDRERESRR